MPQIAIRHLATQRIIHRIMSMDTIVNETFLVGLSNNCVDRAIAIIPVATLNYIA